MALTVTSRGGGATTTGTTTASITGRSATLAAGSLGVLCIALDNAGSGGATAAAPTTATDSKGNVWTRQADGIYDPGAASAGIEGAIYTAPIVTAFLTTDTLTLTWIAGVTVAAKAWTWYEVIPSAGNYAEFSSGTFGAGAGAANGQITTVSIPVGDAVIAGYFSENVAAVTGDSDSTNGSWTAQQTQTVGSTTSGVRIATQQKVQTTTPSTQSYDVTVSSQDRIVGYIVVHEAALNRNVSVAATGGGVAATAGQKGALRSIVATGGGVANEVGLSGRLVSVTATGGGIATITGLAESVENHDGGFAATGGGIAIVGVTTARVGPIAATGGGTAALGAATDRSGSVAATGAGAAVVAQSTERSGSLAATGGGTASVSVQAARFGAAAMSGGGVLTSAQSTERFVSIAATGGGSAQVTGTQGEDHAGGFAATGGGTANIAAMTDRLAAIAATGSGAAAFAAMTQRFGGFAATGGGRAVVTTGTEPMGSLPELDSLDTAFGSSPIGSIFDDTLPLEVTT
jgi:hypothetical protein